MRSPDNQRAIVVVDARFAMFWARVLMWLGMLFVVFGIIFSATALVLDMPWGKLTGQAVVERILAMVVLTVAGVMAGAALIIMAEMMRVMLDQRQLLREIKRELGRRHDEGKE